MELDKSSWDVVIAGTGLQESLLALALSRSDKKILHVDRNRFYAGNEAALSLQEAEDWAVRVSTAQYSSPFSHASVHRTPSEDDAQKLGFARAYSLGLATQLVYARSLLLPGLVSSRVDNQLEFLAMGNWFTFNATASGCHLSRVPSGREDLLASQDMTAGVKRSLVKLLRFIQDPEAAIAATEENASIPLYQYLEEQFKIPLAAQHPIHALVLSSKPLQETTTGFALPRIARHLGSIGVLGPGFGAVIPKWGGLSEVAQIGCRACAVGGGVYVLDNGIKSAQNLPKEKQVQADDTQSPQRVEIELANGEKVTTTWLAGAIDQLPSDIQTDFAAQPNKVPSLSISRSIAIVSSRLEKLFPPPAEGVPPPAGAAILFPAEAISAADQSSNHGPPVHLVIHSSETGECPKGQCVVYASIQESHEAGFEKLNRAMNLLLETFEEESRPSILWRLQFEQAGPYEGAETASVADDSLIAFPPLETDLVFNDILLGRVRHAWSCITGLDPADGGFLNFAPRQEEEDEPIQL